MHDVCLKYILPYLVPTSGCVILLSGRGLNFLYVIDVPCYWVESY